MSFHLFIWTIALALAMDAFAVSVSISAGRESIAKAQAFRLSFAIGLFQSAMTIIGWLAGLSLFKLIEMFDHWVAFFLLLCIGLRMVYESLKRDKDPAGQKSDPTRGLFLIVLSVATSIDALAVGLSLALLQYDVIYPAIVIGVIAFVLTQVGIKAGLRLGHFIGRRAELVGGIVLIFIGLKILTDHLS